MFNTGSLLKIIWHSGNSVLNEEKVERPTFWVELTQVAEPGDAGQVDHVSAGLEGSTCLPLVGGVGGGPEPRLPVTGVGAVNPAPVTRDGQVRKPCDRGK